MMTHIDQNKHDKKSTAHSKEPVIIVENVKKAFGKLQVLKGISFELFENENLLVLGKSGTGKSVLIKCISRLLDYDSGSIKVLGDEIKSLKDKELAEVRKKIGFLFQSGALYDSMTVRQNLEFPLRRIKKGISETEINKKVKEVLENVGLPDTAEKMPADLSGGMRKRISLARTIIVDPLIMLYDEPTTGLDPVTSNEISELIKEVQKKYNTSSIIITHDIKCVQATADRIIMLKDGEVYKIDTLKNFETSKDEFIKSFFN